MFNYVEIGISNWIVCYKQLSKWMTWRYKNVTELMKAKPDLKMKEFSKQYAREACNSGLWTGSRIFSNSKKRWVFRLYAENFVAGVQATQNRQRSRSGMPCLTWALIQPRQRKDVWVHVWRFWVSQIICVLYGEWCPLDVGNRWNRFSYAQIDRTVYSNLYGGHRHAWMHLYEWGWSAVNDPSFDGSWCVLNWKGSWLGFVVLGSSGVAFAPHAIRHAGLDWIGFW